MPDTETTAPWTTARLVVVDVEGNGQRPPGLVELAVVAVIDGVVATPRSWLVKPTSPITGFASRLHGITNADVAAAPDVAAIADEVVAALADAVVVAHNAHIDIDVLRRHLPTWQPDRVVDTLKLARRLLPGQPSYKLGALIAALDLGTELPTGLRAHRADYDALACAHLLLRLANPTGQPPLSLAELTGDIAPRGGDDDDGDRLF